ncbi:MAG: Coenzyme F420 hydrogenase/dehydrogenase, beta subunit C-terminal domain [Candidatus Thorarchaeota archaeon]|nr:Coenzyme F420 hydrogenase/dehydrogenase, beta subunit C-terminal domain [Candidatus Thorarchaeota archaeon]
MAVDVARGLARGSRWLKANTKRLAFRRLKKDVIDREACTECGACVSNCPEDALALVETDDRFVPTLTGKCSACGICYVVCPRTHVFWDDLLGEFRSVWQARVKEGHGGQNGGVVTAILAYMLENDLTDGAVVVRHDDGRKWRPVSTIVRTPEEVQASGGTWYTHAPVVQEMMNGFRQGFSRIAVVGTSCDIDAIHKLETHPAGLLQVESAAHVFKIGLFCMKAFDYKRLRNFMAESHLGMTEITKMEITAGKFRVFVGDEVREWPLSVFDSIGASSCSYCHDLTAKNSDISCGNFGSDDEWTSVIIRSVEAEHIFQEMVAAGILEAEVIEGKPLRTIRNMARAKAMRYYSLPTV